MKTIHQYIRYIILAFVLFYPFLIFGQINTTIKLKKDCKIDTLYVFLQQTDTIDYELNEILQKKFDSIVANFNTQQNKVFQIIIDSSHTNNTIKFVMGKISYVGCKERIITTVVDIVVIAIFPYSIIMFPQLLLPATYCKVDIKGSNDLMKRKWSYFLIDPEAAFANKNKQKEKFKKRFDKEFVNCFNEIEKQYKKNNKKKYKTKS